MGVLEEIQWLERAEPPCGGRPCGRYLRKLLLHLIGIFVSAVVNLPTGGGTFRPHVKILLFRAAGVVLLLFLRLPVKPVHKPLSTN